MTDSKLIWIVEDDPGCLFIYEEILGARYAIRLFATLREFEIALQEETAPRPDLVIADVRLPDGSFARYLSSKHPDFLGQVPIMIVSAVDELETLELCFDKGVVDYICKPFGRAELIVKTRHALGRSESPMESDASILVDPTTLTISRGTMVSRTLTPKEFQIVSLFHRALDRQLTREELVARAWGSLVVTDKTFDVHLSNLRKKLSPLGLEVLYVTPRSYRLNVRDVV